MIDNCISLEYVLSWVGQEIPSRAFWTKISWLFPVCFEVTSSAVLEPVNRFHSRDGEYTDLIETMHELP